MNLKEGISAIVHTYNEETNIRNCLESVKWVDEIVVIDMYSRDKTVEIAKEYTNKIYLFEKKGYADPARQFGVDQASYKWILVIDADEMIPKKLSQRLRKIAENDEADVVYLTFVNYRFGREIRGGGWGIGQIYLPRFFKKGFVRFGAQIHNMIGWIDIKARKLTLTGVDEAIIHFNCVDVDHLLSKLLRDTTVEALNMFDGVKSPLSVEKLLWKMFGEVIERLIFLEGYKDGIIGFFHIFYMVFYHLVSFLKYQFMLEYRDSNVERVVKNIYKEIANNVLSEYQISRK